MWAMLMPSCHSRTQPCVDTHVHTHIHVHTHTSTHTRRIKPDPVSPADVFPWLNSLQSHLTVHLFNFLLCVQLSPLLTLFLKWYTPEPKFSEEKAQYKDSRLPRIRNHRTAGFPLLLPIWLRPHWFSPLGPGSLLPRVTEARTKPKLLKL
jgi:hypothetical protein